MNMMKIIGYYVTQVHIKEESTDDWFLLTTIVVKHLSSEPNLGERGQIGQLRGNFTLRVFARNISGLGEASELAVTLAGWIFCQTFNILFYLFLFPGGFDFNPEEHHRLPEDHFHLTHHTFWEEFLFVSDHGDSPKVWQKSTKKNVLMNKILATLLFLTSIYLTYLLYT